MTSALTGAVGAPRGTTCSLGSRALRRKGRAKQALKDDRSCRTVPTVSAVGAKALGQVSSLYFEDISGGRLEGTWGLLSWVPRECCHFYPLSSGTSL